MILAMLFIIGDVVISYYDCPGINVFGRFYEVRSPSAKCSKISWWPRSFHVEEQQPAHRIYGCRGVYHGCLSTQRHGTWSFSYPY